MYTLSFFKSFIVFIQIACRMFVLSLRRTLLTNAFDVMRLINRHH